MSAQEFLETLPALEHHNIPREECRQIASSRKLQTPFLSYIHCLPSELLGKIFSLCLPQWWPVQPTKNEAPLVLTWAPLVLTWVCKRWREIALHTPELWCSLSIPGTHNGGELEPEQLMPFYDDWLRKAKSYPLALSLVVDVSGCLDHSTQRDVARNKFAVDLFNRYASRCRYLNLHLASPGDLVLLLQDLPLLDHLQLHGPIVRLILPEISIVQPQPRLRTLMISVFTFEIEDLSLFDLGWSNLTHLAMVTQNLLPGRAQLFFGLLQICPNLEHFMFSPAGELEFRDDPIPLVHSKLRVLVLSNEPIGDSFLDTLSLPSLRSVAVFDEVYCEDELFEETSVSDSPSIRGSHHRAFNFSMSWGHQNPITFFDPGWTEITHLTLRVQSSTVVFRILRLCPNLEHVAISSICDTDVQSTAIIHHGLRSLALSNICSDLDLLLDLFTFPNLRHLNIALHRPSEQRWPHVAFRELVDRSQFPLVTVVLSGLVRGDGVGERDFADLIPTLRYVRVHPPT